MTTMVQDPPTGTMSDLMVHSSTWEAQAYQRALAMKNLPQGWDHQHGRTPTSDAINEALTYIGLAAQLKLPALLEPFISPQSEGGVQIEWDNGNRHVEFEISPAGVATYVMIEGTTPTFGDFGAWPKRELQLQELFGWLTAMP